MKIGRCSVMDNLVLGDNFFVVSNYNFNSVYGEELEQMMLIAKMSGYDVFFTTSRTEVQKISYSPTVHKQIKSEKSNDMIHIKKSENNQTLFYLTLTYYSHFNFFHEFGLNPMNEQVQKIIKEHKDSADIMRSNYFYSTTNFHEIRKVLNCALHIVKNI
jgi:hypothetical protein